MSNCLKYATLAAAAALSLPATAAPLAQLGVQDFAYLWEFDGVDTASNYDLYNSATGAPAGDGTNEWSVTTAPVAGVKSTPFNGSTVNTFWTASAAAATQLTALTGYTVEYRLRMTTTDKLLVDATVNGNGTAGSTAAVTGIFNDLGDVDASNDVLDLYFDLASTAGNLGTSVAADEFFVLRIAATPDVGTSGGLSYTVYVNDSQVADGLNAERTNLATRRFFIGDIGGSTAGTTEIDYVGFTPGAFAVPEPGSMFLVGLGALGLVARRRRTAE